MIEPTESENLDELDRFCDALIEIRREIQEIADGKFDRKNNLLKNAPHNLEYLLNDQELPYTRQRAAYPLEYLKQRPKVFPSVGRIDSIQGDRKLRFEY